MHFLLLTILLSAQVAVALPLSILNQFEKYSIKANSIIVTNSQGDCPSCVMENIATGLNFSKIAPNCVFFINKNSKEQSRLNILFVDGGYAIPNANIIEDSLLYSYFFKNNFCFFDGQKLDKRINNSVKLQAISDVLIQTADSISLFVHHKVKYTQTNRALKYSTIFKNQSIYALNTELNHIIALKDSKIDTLLLNSTIDTVLLFKNLNLNFKDSIETRDALVKNTLFGQRIIDFHTINSSNDNFFYVNLTVNTSHELDIEEKKTLIKSSKMARKNLKKDINQIIKANKPVFLIAKYDSLWNFVAYLQFQNLDSNLSLEPYSGSFFDGKDCYSNYKSNEKSNANRNFSFLVSKQEKNRLIPENNSKYLKPTWFSNKNISSGFQWSTFSSSNATPIYQSLWYPFVIDLKQNVLFEIPFDEIESISKREKGKDQLLKFPYFQNVGILKDSKGFVNMVLRSTKTGAFYYGKFNQKGHFLGLKDFPFDSAFTGKVQIYENQFVHFIKDEIVFYQIKN